MFIPSALVRASLARSMRLAPKLTNRKPFDFLPGVRRSPVSQSFVKRAQFLSLGENHPSETEYERMMGTNDLVDEFFLMRALLCAKTVARLSIRNASGGERGYATGFMVSPRLLLTNHHVFGAPEQASPSIAEFNYRDDVAGRPEQSFRHRLRPDRFFFTSKELDFTLVSVEPEPLDGGPPLSNWGWLRLIPTSGKAVEKDWLSIIQHPGGRRRQFAIRENQCVDNQDPQFLWYLSDTAPGSSGAPVFNDSFQVAALHHSGRARKEGSQYVLRDGRRVDSIADVDDSLVDWVANEGVRISRICATVAAEAREREGHLEELKEAMKSGDVLTNAASSDQEETMNSYQRRPEIVFPNNAGISVPVILDLRLSLYGKPLTQVGIATKPVQGQDTKPPVDGGAGQAESYKQPIIDEDYASRTGFDEGFLGIQTPLPKLVNSAEAAKLKGSSSKYVVLYEHFSVVMHKARRLAIFTASNVDWSKKARRPEAGKEYTRDALGGFSENDQEQWVIDPRLPESAQVTDNFYRRDKGAFDKGHLVRRDDVCWGKDYAEVQRANGDTYHLTNCSPQVAGFNRSLSQGAWGLLENLIQAQGKTEKYSIFAGPVLAEDDRDFVGKESTTLTIQVPKAFWKVVLTKTGGSLKAYGFILEQDLSEVPAGAEFQPTGEWKGRMASLKDIEKTAGLFTFAKALHDADQIDAT